MQADTNLTFKDKMDYTIGILSVATLFGIIVAFAFTTILA